MAGRTTKLMELEALRGIAALVVLLHHFMLGFTPRLHGLLYPDQPLSLMGTPAFALINGPAAVIVFFILSGFVLTIGLFRSPDIRRSAIAIVKRWPRLAATVIVANCVAGLFVAFGFVDNVRVSQIVPSIWLGWFYRWPNAGAAEIPVALVEGATTFFTGSSSYNSNLWTMYYEFWGSIIAIGCATACSAVASPKLQSALLIAVWAAALVLSPYMSTFVIGVWFARAFVRGHNASWAGWPAIALAAAAVVLLGYHENLISGRAEGFYASLNPMTVLDPLRTRVVLHSIAATVVLLLFLRVDAIRNAMSGRIGRALGFMSFAVYLVQIPVIASVSSMTFAALSETPHLVQVLATLLITVTGTFLLAIPLASFDRWWVSILGRKIGAIEPQIPASPLSSGGR